MTEPRTSTGLTGASVSRAIAEIIRAQGVARVYSLPGGHMKPIWDALASLGVRVIVARHECAAVHMAQAEADLSGRLAVTIVTTGPGLTNAVTGIASAFVARSPLLVISTRPPIPQEGMGALEQVDQAAIVSPVCRAVHEIWHERHVVPRLDLAISTALGDDGLPGPVYVDFPTDLLPVAVPPSYAGELAVRERRRSPRPPDPSAVSEAADLIRSSRRPLVIAGREALAAADAVVRFAGQSGSLYLDTRSSRGALSSLLAGYVPALRARMMAEADLVITLGRALDFEIGYGSPAIFTNATAFLRIGRTAADVVVNRRGDVELRGDVGLALDALIGAGAAPSDPDVAWRSESIAENQAKAGRLADTLASPPEVDGAGVHPYALIAAINEWVDDRSIVIVDGGDILSWARAGLRTPTYLDLGSFGCLGVGVPFAIAAALLHPDRRVIALIGDGALGFNAMEIETAVREGANISIVVANNRAFNIERADQAINYGGRVFGTELSDCDFAALARSLGAHGERVDDRDSLRSAIGRAVAGAPAVVDVVTSGSPVSADTKSGLALVPPLQALTPWEEAERAWLAASSNQREV